MSHWYYTPVIFWFLIRNILLLLSRSVMSDSLKPHELQHARLPYPSQSPRVCSNSCPLNQWCHSTLSSSVVSSFGLQSLPASGSFPMSHLFSSGGQSIRTSASTSVLPMNIQGWPPLGLAGRNIYLAFVPIFAKKLLKPL